MIKITHKFKTIDGQEFDRASSEDFKTLSHRFWQRIEKSLGDNKQDTLNFLEDGLNKYNQANYEITLKCFNESTNTHTSLMTELKPFIDICSRVLKTNKSKEDLLYEEYKQNIIKWHSRSFFYKLFHSKQKPVFHLGLLESALRVRCKYCGHYTSYKDPYDGFEWMHKVKSPLSNSCEICERSYPSPSADWDNIDGQAYIYYRHSVPEEEFYNEFEKEYNVPKSERDYFVKK